MPRSCQGWMGLSRLFKIEANFAETMADSGAPL
jgi:hypothetical protein